MRTYTMESTYCGYETGLYRGFQVHSLGRPFMHRLQIGIQELKEMGAQLLKAIVMTKFNSSAKEIRTKKTTPKKTVCRQRDLGE